MANGNINLLTNPSFETNTTSWTIANATASRDVAPNVCAGGGNFSLKLVATSAAVVSATVSLTGLTIGQPYTVSFYGKINSGAADFSVVPSIGGSFTSQRVMRTGDGMVRRFMGFIATATTASFAVRSEGNLTIGDTMWIDNAMVNQGGLLPYFDGSYPFCTWSGTAHASTSTCSALSSTIVGNVTTDEIVIANGLCLNTLAWNITTKTGRYSLPQNRGEDYSIPGVNGKTFVANKPIDTALYSLSMFILGAYPDGTVPPSPAQRVFLQRNFEQIVRQCMVYTAPITLYAWHPNGSVRTAQATLTGTSAPDGTMFMGGRRAELTLAFDILPGVWSDYLPITVAGTASSAWSNQTLTLTPLSNGTASIDDSVITVAGPITNPIVSNAATGTSVTYTGTVPNGQSWVIDCGQWTSKVNAVSVLANTTHTGHPRFVLIAPGDMSTTPSLTLTGSSTGAATNLSVTATRKHLVN